MLKEKFYERVYGVSNNLKLGYFKEKIATFTANLHGTFFFINHVVYVHNCRAEH